VAHLVLVAVALALPYHGRAISPKAPAQSVESLGETTFHFHLRQAVHFSKTSPAMGMRSVVFGSLAAFLVAFCGGCSKSAPEKGATNPQPSTLSPPPITEVIARVHWIGMKRLATETNATSFLRMWKLPETAKLEAQTLDKLARWLASRGKEPEIQSALLRPLLDDLIGEESYLELRNTTNLPGMLALAIRVDAQRAALWQTNLAAVLGSVTGARPIPTTNGWATEIRSVKSEVRGPASGIQNPASSMPPPGASLAYSVQLRRTGDWAILALAPSQASGQLPALNPQRVSGLRFDPTTRRLESLLDSPTTNLWLEAGVDLGRAASALSLGRNLPEDLPALSLQVTGNGKDVLTSGRVNFPKPLPLELEPWNIPTNLVHDPLGSFTAIRGIQPWLASLKAWNDLHVGAPPNQVLFWAQPATLPFMTYCAAPLPDASNRVYAVSERLLRECNPWITNNTFGRLEWSTNYHGLGWLGVPFIIPFLRSTTEGGSGFAFGGLFAYPFTNRPPPDLLFQQVTARTNLVYYDWELTGQRVDEWLHIGQLLRLLFGKAHLPPDSASMAWLNAAKTNLANCVTGVGETGPAQLTFSRASTAGLTALEMHLLADWLESPQFPHGFNTFLGPQRPLPRPGAGPPVLKPASAPATNR